MARRGRSARGEMVDFDLLAISAALASAPAPSVVQARREFIDEKDGLKSRAKTAQTATVEVEPSASTSEAMALSIMAAHESASAVEEVVEELPKSKSKSTK
jgi:predicted TPR repeat methyltransferase